MPKLDEFVVAVHADASPPERLAAAQLAHWPSAALPRPTPLFVLPANASAAGKRPRFAVGTALARARPGLPVDALASAEAFACQSFGAEHGSGPATIYLTGGTSQPRGTLNAVFELLRALGFRWWAPSTQRVAPWLPGPGTPVPGRRTAVPAAAALLARPAPTCNRTFDPPFEYRLYNACPALLSISDPVRALVYGVETDGTMGNTSRSYHIRSFAQD